MSLYIQSPLPCKSLLGTAQTCCSASCRCRLRVSAKRSFSTPQECAAITGRNVHRDWDCIPTSKTRTANLQCHACLSLCIYRGPACRYNVIDETKTVSSKTVIWLCRFPKHSNIEVLTGAESGKTACLVSIQELLTA